MLWEVLSLSKCENDLNSLKQQFISIYDLLELLTNIDNSSPQVIAKWLMHNKNLLLRSKSLVFQNEYDLKEYELINNAQFLSPLETIQLLADGVDSDDIFDMGILGFSRWQLLIDLKREGFTIPDSEIKRSEAYISTTCHDTDDNFYKNQCIALREQYVSISNKKFIDQPVKQKHNIRHIDLLDPQKPLMYNKRLACLLRVTYDLLHLEKFDHQPTKEKRIADCLEEYGDEYGYPATDTNVKHFSCLIHTRTKSKKVAKELIENIINPH